MNIAKRIRACKGHKTPSNCFGTVLFIAGIISKDKFVARLWGDDADYERRIEALEELQQPAVYSLAIFRRGRKI